MFALASERAVLLAVSPRRQVLAPLPLAALVRWAEALPLGMELAAALPQAPAPNGSGPTEWRLAGPILDVLRIDTDGDGVIDSYDLSTRSGAGYFASLVWQEVAVGFADVSQGAFGLPVGRVDPSGVAGRVGGGRDRHAAHRLVTTGRCVFFLSLI